MARARAIALGRGTGKTGLRGLSQGGIVVTGVEDDVIEWANEQATLLRAGSFAELDIERIARLVEGVGSAEVGYFYHNLSLVVRHLLTWDHTPQERTKKLRSLIVVRRRDVIKQLRRTPSLSKWLTKADFWQDVWEGAIAERKTIGKELRSIPPTCPWTTAKVIDEAFFPD